MAVDRGVPQELWKEPVVASNGYTCKRSAIKSWMHQSLTLPFARELLPLQLYPNRHAEAARRLLQQTGMDSGAADAPQSSETQDAAKLPTTALLDPINGGQRATALSYLEWQPLPGLNAVAVDGSTVLHWAISKQLPDVAVAVLMREDFQGQFRGLVPVQ